MYPLPHVLPCTHYPTCCHVLTTPCIAMYPLPHVLPYTYYPTCCHVLTTPCIAMYPLPHVLPCTHYPMYCPVNYLMYFPMCATVCIDCLQSPTSVLTHNRVVHSSSDREDHHHQPPDHYGRTRPLLNSEC